jgi:hypothetical protein
MDNRRTLAMLRAEAVEYAKYRQIELIEAAHGGDNG